MKNHLDKYIYIYKSKMSRARNYCWTLNNYTDAEIVAIRAWTDVTYTIWAHEVGEEGTPHLQGYTEFSKQFTVKTLKKRNRRISWHARQGTQEQAINYCKYDSWPELTKLNDIIVEIGTPKQQGKRTDIEEVKDEIIGGKPVDAICLENPSFYHQYGRTLHKIEDICLRKKYRKWMTTCDWYFGPTGIGKSHKAFENFNPETHYVWKDDNGWQDGYTGQETVIINEFRGSIAYATLLQLIDKYPFELRRRGREPVPFLAKHIIITSSLSPAETYHNLAANDALEQLYRRVKVYSKARIEDNWTLI